MRRTVKKNFHFQYNSKNCRMWTIFWDSVWLMYNTGTQRFMTMLLINDRDVYTPGDLDTGHGSLNVHCHSSINLSKFLSRFIVRRMHARHLLQCHEFFSARRRLFGFFFVVNYQWVTCRIELIYNNDVPDRLYISSTFISTISSCANSLCRWQLMTVTNDASFFARYF